MTSGEVLQADDVVDVALDDLLDLADEVDRRCSMMTCQRRGGAEDDAATAIHPPGRGVGLRRTS